MGGKDVWHTRLPDGKHIVVLGKAPQGARILADGPGSAYKTTQTIGNARFSKIEQVHGAVRATITPTRTQKGAQARFNPVNTIPRSVKRGKIYYTPAGKSVLMSRKPLNRRRRQ